MPNLVDIYAIHTSTLYIPSLISLLNQVLTKLYALNSIDILQILYCRIVTVLVPRPMSFFIGKDCNQNVYTSRLYLPRCRAPPQEPLTTSTM